MDVILCHERQLNKARINTWFNTSSKVDYRLIIRSIQVCTGLSFWYSWRTSRPGSDCMPSQNALQAASSKAKTATLSRWTLSKPCTFERTRIFTSPRPIQLSRPAGKMGYLERWNYSLFSPRKRFICTRSLELFSRRFDVGFVLFLRFGMDRDAIEILNKQKDLGQ